MFGTKKVRFSDATSGAPEEKSPQPKQTNTIKRSEAVSGLPIYQRRHFPGISHNNHKHIDDISKYEIRAIDDQIQAAIDAGKPEEIAGLLDALLDKTFFGAKASGELEAALERLDKCDIKAKSDEMGLFRLPSPRLRWLWPHI